MSRCDVDGCPREAEFPDEDGSAYCAEHMISAYGPPDTRTLRGQATAFLEELGDDGLPYRETEERLVALLRIIAANERYHASEAVKRSLTPLLPAALPKVEQAIVVGQVLAEIGKRNRGEL